MRSLSIVGLILSAFLLDAYTVIASPPATAAEHTVTEQDNGRQIRVARGDIVTVRLGSQLGTGYGWEVTRGPGRRLRQTDKSPKIELNRSSGPGASETEVFRFEARRTGRVYLELRYLRPRQKHNLALKSFHVVIVIR
jgi:predicted secreted protein